MAESDPELWSVDRSWSDRVPANGDGEVFPSKHLKLHVDGGDTTAKCSRRILLNSMPGDRSAGRLSEIETDPRMRSAICRRCVPQSHDSDPS